MREDKLFTGEQAHVSTAEFHQNRERANHWEQGHQRPRMQMALSFVDIAIGKLQSRGDETPTLSDLGCGDGGMLAQIMTKYPWLDAWGYDFQESNVHAAQIERGLPVRGADVFNSAPLASNTFYDVSYSIQFGRIAIMTEVLEHLSNPQGVLANLSGLDHTRWLVASSPWGEHKDSHDACHAWAWDFEGYARLFRENGWWVIRHEIVDWSQVVLAFQSGYQYAN